MIQPSYYLVVAAMLFGLGLLGALTRRNALIVFMSLELMLNAANLTFITFARHPLRGLASSDGSAARSDQSPRRRPRSAWRLSGWRASSQAR